jgi:hypothetical protein
VGPKSGLEAATKKICPAGNRKMILKNDISVFFISALQLALALVLSVCFSDNR